MKKLAIMAIVALSAASFNISSVSAAGSSGDDSVCSKLTGDAKQACLERQKDKQ